MSKLFTLSAATTLGSFDLIASTEGLRRVCWPSDQSIGKFLQGAADWAGHPRSSDQIRKVANGPGGSTVRLDPLRQAPGPVAGLLRTTAAQLADYFMGGEVCFSGPLDLSQLSHFARRVLRALSELPYGRTTTYGQLAKDIGAASGARAVGSCLARNPLPLIIPCHRVLGCTGSLGGFSGPGGTALKRHLLMLENIPPPT